MYNLDPCFPKWMISSAAAVRGEEILLAQVFQALIHLIIYTYLKILQNSKFADINIKIVICIK